MPPDPLVPVEEPPRRIDWRRHALFLDFDGTLAPVRDRPEDVEMSERTSSLLADARDATTGAVAVISGRPLGELAGLIGPVRVGLAGSHGAELRFPDRDRDEIAPDGRALATAFAELAPLAHRHDLLIERKPGAIALHFRNRPDLAAPCRKAVEDTAARTGQRPLHGDMVSEVALKGVDKGTALRRFVAFQPFAGRVPVMIGDDTTDEDGFAAAQDLGGFGIRIGGRDSVALYRVATRTEALDWLATTLTKRN